MYCLECGSELMIGAKSCFNCGYPVAPPDLEHEVREVNTEWLKKILTGSGRSIEVIEVDEDTLLVRRPGYMDVAVTVRGDLGQTTFEHSWKVEPPARDDRAELLEAINRANRMSLFSTFYLDSKGVKLKGRSYMVFTEGAENDVIRFFEALEVDFPQTMMASGLLDLLRGRRQH